MKPRADYMTPAQKRAVGHLPRRHSLMRRLLEGAELEPVARPGKTAQDRARKGG